MTARDTLVKALDSAHRELAEALLGLPDADVWRRADSRLLSVGEILAHVAYWEARSNFGDAFESGLFVDPVRYYTSNVDAPLDLPFTAEAITAEISRIHAASRAEFLTRDPDLDAPNPYRRGWSWADSLEYGAFHVAYHTGQIYSVRHLLGHSTSDN